MLRVCIASIQNVTDTQTPHDSIGRDYASHRAAKRLGSFCRVMRCISAAAYAVMQCLRVCHVRELRQNE